MADEARPTQSGVKITGTPSTAVVQEEDPKKKYRRVRKKKPQDEKPNFDNIPGIKKMTFSVEFQRILECVVDEDVTIENPWKYVEKAPFDESIKTEKKKSMFFGMKKDLASFPRPKLYMGYIPSDNRDVDEFYICFTAEAEEQARAIVDEAQRKLEEKVNNAVTKDIFPWKTKGSEVEVDLGIYRNNRPLLEVEFESQYPVISAKSLFRFRNVLEVRDGYAELLSPRTVFQNITRKRIDAAVQVTPSVRFNEAQTTYSFPVNASTQYKYEWKPIKKRPKRFDECFKLFKENNLEDLDDMIYVNSYINFYKNDYFDLILDENSTRTDRVELFNEYVSFMDIYRCKGKFISGVSWHPMRTGTVALSYVRDALAVYLKTKPNVDVVLETIYNVVPVLLWCFDDHLHAKLYLEATREVTTISFCPFNEDILVGGCVNGQVIIWDIKNKIENVEKVEILTPNQQKYRTLMASLMTWMKNTTDLKIVRQTAISNLAYSHTTAVTGIRWVSVYREVSKSGQIKNIPEEEHRTSLQFLSSSRDGTVLSWDLNETPSLTATAASIPRRKQRKPRPSSLNVDVSPFKILNRLLKPIFKVNVSSPGTQRNLPLTAFNVRVTQSIYVEKYPNPNRKFNIAERIYYKPIFIRPTYPCINQFIAGTTEGEFLIASWEGFSFNSGEVVNKENCKLDNYGKYHDGPVVSLARSEAFPELVLTVGGKVFALWKVDFIGQPVLWRRSRHKYTHAVWNTYRPSMFRLCRDDGYAEVWHLQTRSDRYQDLIPMSGGTLLGTFTHPRVIKKNVMGVADYSGSLRLFFISKQLIENSDEDKHSTLKICLRDADKKLKFQKWQEEWKKKNADWINARKEQEDRLRQEKENEARKKKEDAEREQQQREREEAARQAALAKPEPGKYEEWAERQWIGKEKKRMNRALLAKKALDFDLLEKQQAPLLKVMAAEEMKKEKLKQRRSDSDKLFNNAIAMLFPSILDKEPPPPPDPYGVFPSAEVRAYLYENYKTVAKESEQLVMNQKYSYTFDWHKILAEGKERRKIIDGYYDRKNHTRRLKLDKSRKESKTFVPHGTSTPTGSKEDIPGPDFDIGNLDDSVV